MGPPVTPESRHLMVLGRWRCADPRLTTEERARPTTELIAARRSEGAAVKAGDDAVRETARARVYPAEHALGERGPCRGGDGGPDVTRHLARIGPHAGWS